MRRLHMRSRDYNFMVEDQANVFGLTRMKSIRREDPRFKYQRIETILQLSPSKVPLNEIIETT